MANEVKIRIEAESNTRQAVGKTEKEVTELEKALTRAELEAKDAEKAIRGIKQAGPSLDQTRADAKKLGAELDDVGDAGKDAAGTLEGSFASLDFGNIGGDLLGMVSGLAGPLGAGAAALGGVFAGSFTDGVAFELGAGRRSIATQLRTGLSEAEVAEAGATAGGLYAAGFGESAAQISADVADIIDSLNDLPTALTTSELSRLAIGLQEAIGIDLRRQIELTRSLVRNGLAPDVETAFDLIGQGFQDADGQGDEFANLLQQFGASLEAMGFTGPAAVKLITEALKDGEFQADKLVDSVQEFKTLLLDGSSEEALTRIGISAEQMLDLFNEGRGVKALEIVLTRLGEIDDAARRNAEAAEIMGTGLEEGLSPELFAQILGIAGAIDEVTFSTSAATDTLEENKSAWDRSQRAVGRAAGAWSGFLFQVADSAGIIDAVTDSLDFGTRALGSLTAALDNFSVSGFIDQLKRIPGSIDFPQINLPGFGDPGKPLIGSGGGPPLKRGRTIPKSGGGGPRIGGPRAVGGSASAGLQLVGEGGPELVRLPGGSSVMPASNTASAINQPQAGMTVMINVAGSIRSDKDLVRLVKDELDSTNNLAGLGRD